AVLRRWLAAHRARQQRFARALAWPELALWEDFELYVEGLARHVENSFVVDAARHPGAKAALAGDPRYHAFAGLEGKLYVYPKYGRMRAQTWFYEMGAHLARLLDRAVGSAWHQTVANHPGFLVAEVQRATRRSR
ncbi:MAG: hypothetical protein KC503_20740, partial [Myxococcales bacterium]|nr:hypothetical protein [Myxococcales bacterium]